MSQIKQLQPKEGVTISAILAPEGSTGYTIIGGKIIFDIKHGLNNKRFDLPEGNWKLLGKATEIPEEVWQGIVEEITFGKNTIPMYRNYKYPMPQCTLARKTATESAMSLLSRYEVYAVNPWAIAYQFDQCRAWQFNEAEANTGTWVILQRV